MSDKMAGIFPPELNLSVHDTQHCPESSASVPDRAEPHALQERARWALAESVGRVVREETRGQIRDLIIDCTHDRVILTGIAESYFVKTLANKAACCLGPEHQFVNDVAVIPPISESVTL